MEKALDKDFIRRQRNEAARRIRILKYKGFRYQPDEYALETIYVDRYSWIKMVKGDIEGKQMPNTRKGLHETDKIYEEIRRFEKETGSRVYHCVEDKTSQGSTVFVFYVSACEEDWVAEANNLKRLESLTYTFDPKSPENSGYKEITFDIEGGHLERRAKGFSL